MTVDGFPEYYSLRSYVSGGNLCLNLQEIRFSAVGRWAYGEVDPIAASLVALDEELIEILLRTIRYIQQDRCIADSLLEYDGALIYTDGYAPKPKIPVGMRSPLCWVLRSEKEVKEHEDWMRESGRVCFIE